MIFVSGQSDPFEATSMTQPTLRTWGNLALSPTLSHTDSQLALPLPEQENAWDYAIVEGLKFKYTVNEGQFLVGHSKAVTRPFEDVVAGFYEFAGTWFEPESLAFIPFIAPWVLYGWSDKTAYVAPRLSASLAPRDVTASVWVGRTGGTTIRTQIQSFKQQKAVHPRAELIAELDDAIEAAKESNWDGYGGVPTTTEAREGALKFINLLAPDIPDPEITPGSGGEVTFDWYRSTRLIFSVSIADTSRLYYAGLFGENKKLSGTEPLGHVLPDSVRLGISRVLDGIVEERR